MTWTWPPSNLHFADSVDTLHDSDWDNEYSKFFFPDSPSQGNVHLCPGPIVHGRQTYETCYYDTVIPFPNLTFDYSLSDALAHLDARSGLHDWYTASLGFVSPSDMIKGKLDPSVDFSGGTHGPGCKGFWDFTDYGYGTDVGGDFCKRGPHENSQGAITDGSGPITQYQYNDGTARLCDSALNPWPGAPFNFREVPYYTSGVGLACPDPHYPDTSSDAYIMMWEHDQFALYDTFVAQAGGNWTYTGIGTATYGPGWGRCWVHIAGYDEITTPPAEATTWIALL